MTIHLAVYQYTVGNTWGFGSVDVENFGDSIEDFRNAEKLIAERHGYTKVIIMNKILLNPESDTKVWLLYSTNFEARNGQEFEYAFVGKPTLEQLQKHFHLEEGFYNHMLAGDTVYVTKVDGKSVNTLESKCFWDGHMLEEQD